MAHRGGGGRDQPAEQAGGEQAAALPEQSRRDVGGQADAHDQHHHQPDLERVEDLVAVERAVGQERQDDEPDENEAEDRAGVVLADARHQTVERLAMVQEDRDHAGDDDALGDEAGAERGADREHHQRRHLGGDPDRARVAPARRVDLAPGADADHDGDGEQRRRDEPAAETAAGASPRSFPARVMSGNVRMPATGLPAHSRSRPTRKPNPSAIAR